MDDLRREIDKEETVGERTLADLRRQIETERSLAAQRAEAEAKAAADAAAAAAAAAAGSGAAKSSPSSGGGATKESCEKALGSVKTGDKVGGGGGRGSVIVFGMGFCDGNWWEYAGDIRVANGGCEFLVQPKKKSKSNPIFGSCDTKDDGGKIWVTESQIK